MSKFRGILDDIIIFDNYAFYENDRVRIEMKPEKSDLYDFDYACKYIGEIIDVYTDFFKIRCGNYPGRFFNIYIKEIDKIRLAHEKETFVNTPNFEDTYKEEV